jgi:4-amino-4-deoxy-L-arabinose transferase-like glycosyltransferase
MTYHMPRVIHWITNKNVSFYTTACTRQNYQMPLAEFAIMHLQVLTGFDLYANLVQWVSFLVLIGLGFLVASELGLSRRQQLISAIIIATIPMAILQSSSTQNDLVVSSFIMSFALFMLRLRKRNNVENLLFSGIAFGLALLTKGTAYIFCAPIGIFLAIPILLDHLKNYTRFIKVIGSLSLVVMIALSLNTGHLMRNYNLYGNPLSTEGELYQNQDMSLSDLIVNIARNGALHLGTPSARVNQYMESSMERVWGYQLNNPKTTYEGKSFSIPFSRHEDTAGNLVHMLIILISVIILPIMLGLGYYRKVAWYGVGVILGSIYFCWTLKWQPWASRLHTPLFAMSAPLLAIAITTGSNKIWRRMSQLIVIIMVFYSLFFLFGNSSRSLISLDWFYKNRIELYFVNKNYKLRSYEEAIEVVQKADNQGVVGLYFSDDDWEYPVWVFAHLFKGEGATMTFRHVGVNNISESINDNSFLPEYVISTKQMTTWKHVAKYTCINTFNYIKVYKKLE